MRTWRGSPGKVNSSAQPGGVGKSSGPSVQMLQEAAFTLLELAVSAGIVAVLASLLLPALHRAKRVAQSTVCLSNLRQFGFAAQVYSMDNNGTLPEFQGWLSAATGNQASGTVTRPDVTTGELYPYLPQKGAYLCPTDKLVLDSRPIGDPVGNPPTRACSYAMNCILCHNNDTARFTAPARALLFMETTMADEDLYGMVGPRTWRGIKSGMSRRHNGGGHIVYCDSHVQRVVPADADALWQSKGFWLPAATTDLTTARFMAALPDP